MDAFAREALESEIREHEQAAHWLGLLTIELRSKLEAELNHVYAVACEEATRAHDLKVILEYEKNDRVRLL